MFKTVHLRPSNISRGTRRGQLRDWRVQWTPATSAHHTKDVDASLPIAAATLISCEDEDSGAPCEAVSVLRNAVWEKFRRYLLRNTDPSDESPDDEISMVRQRLDRQDVRDSSGTRRRAVLSYEQIIAGASKSVSSEANSTVSVRVAASASAEEPIVRDPLARPMSPPRAPGAARPVIEIVALDDDRRTALVQAAAEPVRQMETSSGQPTIEPVEPTAHPQRNTAEVSAAFPERLQLSPSQRAAMRDELSRR